jgi:hypothetical protein
MDLLLVRFFQVSSPFLCHEPDIIEEQKRKGCIGPFEVAPKKANCAVNDDAGNDCELNYRKGFFHFPIPESD